MKESFTVPNTQGMHLSTDGAPSTHDARQREIDTLRAEQRLFIDMLNSSPMGIGISDIETSEILYSNEALEKIHGIFELGTKARDYWVDPEQRNEFIKRFKNDGDIIDHEVKLRRANGDEFWSLLTWKKIKYNRKECLIFWVYEIDDRKKAQEQLIESQNKLIENAHAAGKAEVATSVLHNVGNLLNSVIFSYENMNDIHENSILQKFLNGVDLLHEQGGNLKDFMCNNPKGITLLEYFKALSPDGTREQESMEHHLERMLEKITAIRDVIQSQQDFATTAIENQLLQPKEVMRSSIEMIDGSLEQFAIEVYEQYESNRAFRAQKSKVQHIIINLLKNAKEELMFNAHGDRDITVRSFESESQLHISVSNNGKPIEKEFLNKIFNHGFTTKHDGHGFGLHSCSNYMTEMGGSISVKNNPTKGVCFTLTFPLDDIE